MPLSKEEDAARQRAYREKMKDDPEYQAKARARRARYLEAKRQDPEWMERERKRKNEARKRRRMTDSEFRLREIEQARERRKVIAASKPKVQRATFTPLPVPMEIRQCYSKAHPNSIIKQKFPTWDALRKAHADGRIP